MPIDFDAIESDIAASSAREATAVDVHFLIDDSSSMSSQQVAVRAGLENFAAKLKDHAGKIHIRSFTQDNIPLDRLSDYRANYGSTPLYDTLSDMVTKAKTSNNRSIFVVVSDGGDNRGGGPSCEALKQAIPELEGTKGWQFLYAANQEPTALAAAKTINIKPGKMFNIEGALDATGGITLVADKILEHLASGDIFQTNFFGG